MEQWMDLVDRVVIVTGGSSGIGRAICNSLSRLGAKVINVDIEPPSEEGSIEFISCDITKKKETEQLAETVYERYGKIDALVNNAGVNRARLLVDTKEPKSKYELSEADYEAMMNVNVKGTVFLSQAVARKMIACKKGVIVNMSSTSGARGSAGQCIYAATKAALNSFTKSLALELGKYGIRVVAVTPGINEKTAMTAADAYMDALAYTRNTTKEAVDNNYEASIPLGRLGKLEEIADLVCYLISDRASYITGTVLNVSGGKTTD